MEVDLIKMIGLLIYVNVGGIKFIVENILFGLKKKNLYLYGFGVDMEFWGVVS